MSLIYRSMWVIHYLDLSVSLLFRLEGSLLALDLGFKEGSQFSLFSESLEVRRLESFLQIDLSSLTLRGFAVDARSIDSKLLAFLTLLPTFECYFIELSIFKGSLLFFFSLLSLDCLFLVDSFISSRIGASFLFTFLLLSSTASYLTSQSSSKLSKNPRRLSFSYLFSTAVSSVLMEKKSSSLENFKSDPSVR